MSYGTSSLQIVRSDKIDAWEEKFCLNSASVKTAMLGQSQKCVRGQKFTS